MHMYVYVCIYIFSYSDISTNYQTDVITERGKGRHIWNITYLSLSGNKSVVEI